MRLHLFKEKKISLVDDDLELFKLQLSCNSANKAEATNLTPSSVQGFEKLIFTNPNNSSTWIKFMSYYLNLGRIDEARAVAERAIDKINPRLCFIPSLEEERWNIWAAWLNLENEFCQSSNLFEEVFANALLRNEPLKVYQYVGDILAAKNSTLEKAEEVYLKMVKKFGGEKIEAWTSTARFYLKSQQKNKCHNLMQKALKILKKPNSRVDLICKFAKLEFTLGEFERGVTLMETLVSSYPKRLDIWFVYFDALVKKNEDKRARILIQRMSALKMSKKKLRSVLEKYLHFEERFTLNEVKIAEVREKLKNLNQGDDLSHEPEQTEDGEVDMVQEDMDK